MRKPKYHEANVNNKKYYLYEIIWEDITGDSGHASTEDLIHMKPAIKSTIAYIVEEDEKYLWTASTNDVKDDEWSDRNVFPLGCILSKKKIEIK